MLRGAWSWGWAEVGRVGVGLALSCLPLRAGLTGWDPFDLVAAGSTPALAPALGSPWAAVAREGDASVAVVDGAGRFSPRDDDRVLRMAGTTGGATLLADPAPAGVGRAGTVTLRARVGGAARLRVRQGGAELVVDAAASTGGPVRVVLVVNPGAAPVTLDDGTGLVLSPGTWRGWVGGAVATGSLDAGSAVALPLSLEFSPGQGGGEALVDDVRWDDRPFGPAGPLWRQAAEARIRAVRTATLVVEAVDVFGRPRVGERVSVRQVKSAFPFGTAIRDGYVFASAPAWYRAQVLAWFDAVTLEGGLRWPQWEIPSRRENTLAWLGWARANGLAVRGHVLAYPQPQHLPADVSARLAEGDGAYAVSRLDAHLGSILPATAGMVDTWDVLNEPVQSQAIQDLVGPEVEVAWFARARQLAPGVPLVVNQNNVVASPANLAAFRARLDRLVALGADFDRIGVQGHFRNSRADTFPQPEEYWARLAELASYGKDLEVTEFDVFNSDAEHPIQWSEIDEARIAEEFAIQAFSHPRMRAFTLWGFWDTAHWQGNAPMLDASGALKLSGRMLLDLFRGAWRTDLAGATGPGGTWSGDVFHGRLEVKVGEGSGAWRREVDGAPGGKVLLAVVGTLAATGSPAAPWVEQPGTGSVRLRWADPFFAETGWELQVAPVGAETWSTIATLAADATSTRIEGLVDGSPARYRLRAVGGAGDATAWSLPVVGIATRTWAEWVAAVVPGGAGLDPAADDDRDGLPNLLEYALGRNPLAPSGGQVADLARDGSGTVRVTWAVDPAAGPLAWAIEAADSPAGPWQVAVAGVLPHPDPTGDGAGRLGVPLAAGQGGFVRLRVGPVSVP